MNRFFTNALIFLAIFSINFSSAQVKHDNHWILTNYVHLEFDSNEINVEIAQHPDIGIATSYYHVAESDRNGELQFHSSGCFVMDKNHNIMENGAGLNPGHIEFGYCQHGLAVWDQNAIILPVPGSESQYLLFTLDMDAPFPIGDTMYSPLVPLHLLYHEIDMEPNEGNGRVLRKNEIVIADTLSRGYVQACKHANGRDWWLTVPEWNSNCYYVVLIEPEGISIVNKNCSGPVHGDLDYGASVVFSPDGQWYARSFSWLEDTLGQVDIFSFDRCSGELSHKINLKFPTALPYYTGVSFSNDSRLIYVSTYKSLWQFDLTKTDIQNSIILAGVIENEFTPLKGSLFFQQLAPDGRIYIGSAFGHYYLSRIHYPDRIGMECGFIEHDFPLPQFGQNYRGLPNYPYYRLGPIDGNICDTLGINNIPVANFRYEIDSNIPLKIEFINLSYFEPETFTWDFGDGNIVGSKHSVHHYANPGIYNVCLTADNIFGTNTYCTQLNLLNTSSLNNLTKRSISFHPNPAKDELHFDWEASNLGLIQLDFYEITGKIILQGILDSPESTLDISSLQAGYYFIKVTTGNYSTVMLKLIKI